MKINELIQMVDERKENAFSPQTKFQFLNECEGMVQTEIFLRARRDVKTYQYPEDEAATLLVLPPHDKLYVYYLCAMIDVANGETNKYANTMQIFNACYAEFMRWYARNYRPADVTSAVAETRYREVE